MAHQRSRKGQEHRQRSIEVDVDAEGRTPKRIAGDVVGAQVLIGKARDQALHEHIELTVSLDGIDPRGEFTQHVEP